MSCLNRTRYRAKLSSATRQTVSPQMLLLWVVPPIFWLLTISNRAPEAPRNIPDTFLLVMGSFK